ncbi:pyrroloquinoline quinone biosynthesis protein PqqE [Ketobacter sp. MCCC 1A13808]|uniref:pyrroloquinoline quinone biosynthesis protein PqqE n=1 Tax=Ketobacter sp. MCCC 1A13808 TaxID=2602738 RepID=UPI000F174A49|nr:pyrroloquinoline quinone biosynthesis protein PqqE [Ketobacter sp. MCCC 1A13808]MVF13218.1 pyrroloquinoline quinone biosynthesis protein PqqE [Ketobacter sp. MCCC 1A13808]RLP54215.1 MAG: pyrroloquinoline quinone biosynthesis protein PqqE [Ketobacter sp.]
MPAESFFNSARPIPLWLLAELTYACPLQCPYCSNPTDFYRSRKHELNTAQWIDVLQQARKLGAVQLGLSGGEPLLRQDLPEILAAAKSLGYFCNLITSAVGLTTEKLDQFKRLGLDHIQISFQGSDRETNHRFGGTDSFDHKLAMTRSVIERQIALGLNFVLHRHNLHQVPDFLRLAASLGAQFVELANTQYYGWALQNRQQLLPTREQLQKAEEQTNDFRKQHPAMDVFFVAPDYYETRPKKCCNGWATTFMTVAPDGDVLPCQSARVIPGLAIPNVKQASLQSIWHDSAAFNQFRGTQWMQEPCKSCPEKEADLGGCRCQAFLLTGDVHAADPVCELSPQHHLITDFLVQATEKESLSTLASSRPHSDAVDKIVWRNSRNGKALADCPE